LYGRSATGSDVTIADVIRRRVRMILRGIVHYHRSDHTLNGTSSCRRLRRTKIALMNWTLGLAAGCLAAGKYRNLDL